MAAAPNPPDPLLSHVLSAEPRVRGVLFLGWAIPSSAQPPGRSPALHGARNGPGSLRARGDPHTPDMTQEEIRRNVLRDLRDRIPT